MGSSSSVVLWLDALRAGDEDALEKLWNRFARQMTGLAATWLRQFAERLMFDEEDVAISAFDAFRMALADGRYSSIQDVDELWRLLAVITVRKASDHLEAEHAQKRGGDLVVVSLDDTAQLDAQKQPSPEPTPEFAALMTDECRRLLKLLGDPELEAVVLWKLHGYTNQEIAEQMKYSRRTIQRMLNLIKDRWSLEVSDQ